MSLARAGLTLIGTLPIRCPSFSLERMEKRNVFRIFQEEKLLGEHLERRHWLWALGFESIMMIAALHGQELQSSKLDDLRCAQEHIVAVPESI